MITNYTNEHGVEYVSIANEDGSGKSMTLEAYQEEQEKENSL